MSSSENTHHLFSDVNTNNISAPTRILTSRRAIVGGFDIARVLPQQSRRRIGPWCFVDIMGPGVTTRSHGLNVGPHPHIGLQTVTWLIHGSLLHRDSLGSEQSIIPGELNLMSAGRGVSHSEETENFYEGPFFGVQLWIAQPEITRHDAPAFEHHEKLPQFHTSTSTITVLIGEFDGNTSPARRDTNHVGIEVHLKSGLLRLPLDNTFEYGLLALSGEIHVNGQHLAEGQLAFFDVGTESVVLESHQDARILVIGGEPFQENVVMWWNYVARTRDEIKQAHHEWSERMPRFGNVKTSLPTIDTFGPPW